MNHRKARRVKVTLTGAALLLVASACTSDSDATAIAAAVEGSAAAFGGTTDAEPIAVANDFVRALWAHDVEKALSYRDPEDLVGLARDRVRLDEQLRVAWRFEAKATASCAPFQMGEPSVSRGSTVDCPYEYQMLGSDQLGLGPYPGVAHVTVRDGQVVAVSGAFPAPQGSADDPFSHEVWEPFETWVHDNHPEDVDALSVSGSWLTDESFHIWETLVPEYVESER